MPTIRRAGLSAGVLDLTAAIIFYAHLGTRTVLMLQGIASGLLGKAALNGGLATALLGCVVVSSSRYRRRACISS